MARLFSLVSVMVLAACSTRGGDDAGTPDGGARDGGADAALDAGPDADAATEDCRCLVGDHEDHIFLMSDDRELWRYDPVTGDTTFVVGPVCAGMQPFSMAVDARGIAHVLFIDSLGILTFDVNDPAACADSGYLRRDMRFGLMGMSFASNSASDTCADLYVQTFSGSSTFGEGPGLGWLGVIDAASHSLSEIAAIDYDGGELTGTGDGRLFSLAGVDPLKITEYDKATGTPLEIIPLTGFRKTNASAVAFFAGDLYAFIEATPAGCVECLETTCGADYTACQADSVCPDDLACAIEEAGIRDECGGSLSSAMMMCVPMCGVCFTPSRARVSQVLRYDLDASDGPTRTLTRVGADLPIRVVGAASSPCVPIGPF